MTSSIFLFANLILLRAMPSVAEDAIAKLISGIDCEEIVAGKWMKIDEAKPSLWRLFKDQFKFVEQDRPSRRTLPALGTK